jgi:hypothetical protein
MIDGTVVGRWTSERVKETMIVDRAKGFGSHSVAYVGRARGGTERLPPQAPAEEIREYLERGAFERVPPLPERGGWG